MKKLLALLVSAMMAVSLAVPAFAAPGLSPEEAASLGVIGGADGPTAIFTTSPVDWGVLLDESYMDSDTAIDWFKEKHPERVAALRANVKDFYEQEYGEYWTAEQYMEEFGVTEEEFLEDMVKEQLLRLYFDEGSQWIADMQKEAMGGVVGQIGVIVNGTYVQFPDAAPEVANGRTMVPVRALVESLGGEVEADGGKIVCRTDEVSITFTLGSAEALVEYPGGGLPGDGQIFPLGCAPYLKGGRTYVPVRFTAEALGYEVGWDGDYKTAVFTSQDALAGEIDKSFAILNRVLANLDAPLDNGQAYRTTQKSEAVFTAFDTLDGDTTYSASASGEQLLSAEAVSGSYRAALSDTLAEALVNLLAGEIDPLEEDADKLAADLKELLKAIDYSYIITCDGLAWMRSNLLAAGGVLDGDAWYALPLGPEGAAGLFEGGEAPTVGRMLTAGLDGDSALSWKTVTSLAEEAAAVVGDGCFTTAGGVSTLRVDAETLVQWLTAGSALDGMGNVTFKELDLTLTVDGQGKAVLSFAMHARPENPLFHGAKVALKCELSSGLLSVGVDAHLANVGTLKLTASSTWQATGQKPMTQPPEGDTILDLNDLMEP